MNQRIDRIVGITWRIVGLLLVAVLAMPVVSSAQSLGSVAKKERERRDKNKEKGVVAHEFSEDEVFGEKDKDKDKDEAKEGEDSGGPESDSDGASAASTSNPLGSLGPVDSKTIERKDSDQESRDRRRSEAEWRARMQQARQRVSAAQERVKFFSELYLAQGERYVDENGNTVVSTPAQLQSLTKSAKDDLAAASKALEDLQEEARHAGVPPGWLR